jgi:hypothetical protein
MTETVCVICLKTELDDPTGLDGCTHTYCRPCIHQWTSGYAASCPHCKAACRFLISLATDIRVAVVPPVHPEEEPQQEAQDGSSGDESDEMVHDETLDDIECEICCTKDKEHEMLLCDSCLEGYHMSCLRPRLAAVPDGHWFCGGCASMSGSEATSSSEEDEEEEVEVEVVERALPTRRQLSRAPLRRSRRRMVRV